MPELPMPSSAFGGDPDGPCRSALAAVSPLAFWSSSRQACQSNEEVHAGCGVQWVNR